MAIKSMAMMKMNPRGLLFTTLSVVLSTGLALSAAEVILRLAIPASTTYFVLIPKTRRISHPSSDVMPGVGGESRYLVNEDGIRGRKFGSDGKEYRILAVGGSTTESLYLDESKSWPFLIEDALKVTPDGRDVWVGNIGRSGMTTRDHVVHVKYLLPQYPPVDLLLILVGVNDLTVALKKGENYVQPRPITEPDAEKEQIRRAFLIAPGRIYAPATEYWLDPNAPWYKGTVLWQLMKRGRLALKNRFAENLLSQDDRGMIYVQWRRHRKSARLVIDEVPDMKLALEEYERNLNAIIDMGMARHVRLVFLSQPSIWRDDLSQKEQDLLWLGGVGEFQSEPNHPYYSASALAKAMALYNDALRNLCQRRQIEFFDLASQLPRDTSIFFDDVHFTEHGSKQVAKIIVGYLREKPPFKGTP